MVEFNIRVRGIGQTLRTYRSVFPRLSEAQRRAGLRVGNRLKREAQEIIRDKAPKTRGTLRNSLFVLQNRRVRGWTTFVRSNAPYAAKVERGHSPETIPVTKALLDWAARVLGDSAMKNMAKKETVTVRKGNNPRYDTAKGMRFLQIPFAKHKNRIKREYEKEVDNVLEAFR